MRFSVIGNNRKHSKSPNSAIGIGVGSYERSCMTVDSDHSEYMAYFCVK